MRTFSISIEDGLGPAILTTSPLQNTLRSAHSRYGPAMPHVPASSAPNASTLRSALDHPKLLKAKTRIAAIVLAPDVGCASHMPKKSIDPARTQTPPSPPSSSRPRYPVPARLQSSIQIAHPSAAA